MAKRVFVPLLALAIAAGWIFCGLRLGHVKSAISRSSAVQRAGTSRSPFIDPTQSDGGAAWRPVFTATFSGPRLNTSMWDVCLPGKISGCTNFGNTEYQWYLPSQVQVSASALHLIAQPIPTLGKTYRGTPEEYACRSGIVSTYSSFEFEYGHLQVVARIPSGPGLWSGLWLAAANLRWPPEIDLLEAWGMPSRHAGVYFHPSEGPRIMTNITGNFSSGWHTFDLYWSPSQLTWFIDGRKVMSTGDHVPHQKMYFVADLADYSLAEAGSCNGQLLIRSVKVWQPNNLVSPTSA